GVVIVWLSVNLGGTNQVVGQELPPPTRPISAMANAKFLTLPFLPDPDMHVQQGMHVGIDYIKGVPNNKSTWTNFDVIAPADGYVCKVWRDVPEDPSLGGWYVRIARTANGINFTTEYNHLGSAESFITLCNSSTFVARGQKIGVAGDENIGPLTC